MICCMLITLFLSFFSVHRDLKPHNILLKETPSKEFIALISDFGLCRKVPYGRNTVTTKEDLVGTIGWIAPEVPKDPSKVVSVYLCNVI